MITRRTLTVPKTTLVGIMLEISFARLTSMAAFNEMVTLPVLRSLGLGGHGCYEKAVRSAAREQESEVGCIRDRSFLLV